MENQTLEFKQTVSRGQDTYGYSICSLWIHGTKVSSCNGGGYDMQGTALGDWMQGAFQDQLKKLKANYGSRDAGKGGFYGLTFGKKTKKGYKRLKRYSEGASVTLDGACGFNSMTRILKEIGYILKYVSETNKTATYLLEVK